MPDGCAHLLLEGWGTRWCGSCCPTARQPVTSLRDSWPMGVRTCTRPAVCCHEDDSLMLVLPEGPPPMLLPSGSSRAWKGDSGTPCLIGHECTVHMPEAGKQWGAETAVTVHRKRTVESVVYATQGHVLQSELMIAAPFRLHSRLRLNNTCGSLRQAAAAWAHQQEV